MKTFLNFFDGPIKYLLAISNNGKRNMNIELTYSAAMGFCNGTSDKNVHLRIQLVNSQRTANGIQTNNETNYKTWT